MQRALYDPDEGYYTTRASVGKRETFDQRHLSPAFAEAIANWAQQTADRLRLPKGCPLIELGPGSGALARELASRLPQNPLHLVETSPVLRRAQSAHLAELPHTHHDDLESALVATGGIALIVANEFVDAFPATKLRWQGDDWHEVGVRFAGSAPQKY